MSTDKREAPSSPKLLVVSQSVVSSPNLYVEVASLFHGRSPYTTAGGTDNRGKVNLDRMENNSDSTSIGNEPTWFITSAVKDKFQDLLSAVTDRGFLTEVEATIWLIMEASGHTLMTLIMMHAKLREGTDRLLNLNKVFKANLCSMVSALINECKGLAHKPLKLKDPINAKDRNFDEKHFLRVFKLFRQLVIVYSLVHSVSELDDAQSMETNWKLLWDCIEEQVNEALPGTSKKLTDFKLTEIMYLAPGLVKYSVSGKKVKPRWPRNRSNNKRKANNGDDDEDDPSLAEAQDSNQLKQNPEPQHGAPTTPIPQSHQNPSGSSIADNHAMAWDDSSVALDSASSSDSTASGDVDPGLTSHNPSSDSDVNDPALAPNGRDGEPLAQHSPNVRESGDHRMLACSRCRPSYYKSTIVSVHGHANVTPNSGSGASRGVKPVSVNRAEELNVPGRRDQGPPPQLMEGPRKRAREVGECAREPAQQRRRLADDGGEGGGEAEDRRLLDGLHDDGSEEDERVVDAEMVVPDPAAEAGVPADSGANADGGRHTDISSDGGGAESDAERAPNKSDPPARREPTSGTVAGEQFDETDVGGSPQEAQPLGRGERSVGGDALSETTGYFTATERWEELEDDEDAGKNSEVLTTDGGNDAAAETLDGDATDLLERSYEKLDAPMVGTDCSTSSEDTILDLLRRLGEVLVPTSGVDPVPQDCRGRPDYTSLIVNPRSRLETRVLSGTSMIDVLSRLMDAAGVLLKKWLGAELGDRTEDFQRWLELQHKSRATDLTSEQRGQAARLLGAVAHLAEARREVEESIMDVGKWPNPTRVGVEVTLVEVAPHADTRAGGGGEDSSAERAGHNAAPPARRAPAPSFFDDDDTGFDSAGEEEGVLPAPMDRGEDDGDDDGDEDDEVVEGSTAGGVNVGMHDPDDDSQMKDEASDDGAAVSSDNDTNPKLDLLNLLWRLGQVLQPSSDVEVPRSVDGRPDYASLISNPASLLEAMVLVPGASTVGVLYRVMQVVSVALEEWGHEVVADLAARARDVLWDRSRTGAIELSLDELDEAAYLLYSINLWLCTEQHGDAEGIHCLVIDLLGRVPTWPRSGVGETGGD